MTRSPSLQGLFLLSWCAVGWQGDAHTLLWEAPPSTLGGEGVEFLPLVTGLCCALQPSFTTSEAGTFIDSCDSFLFGSKPSGGRDVTGKKLGDLNGTR